MRTILLGMNNPLSGDPDHALYPSPAGCTGYRIYEMLREGDGSVSVSKYLRVFDRRNLVAGRAWSPRAGREAGAALRAELRGATILVLGAQTWRSLRFEKRPEPGHEDAVFELCGCGVSNTWHYLPHPSGLNRWYNDPANRAVAVRALTRLAYL